jgi:putative addiction module component (TIGR02574 family)
MVNALQDITQEALKLTRQQRLALAGFLLELDEPNGDAQVDAVWEEEIRARIQAIDDGTAVGIPYEAVMREAQKRLAP